MPQLLCSGEVSQAISNSSSELPDYRSPQVKAIWKVWQLKPSLTPCCTCSWRASKLGKTRQQAMHLKPLSKATSHSGVLALEHSSTDPLRASSKKDRDADTISAPVGPHLRALVHSSAGPGDSSGIPKADFRPHLPTLGTAPLRGAMDDLVPGEMELEAMSRYTSPVNLAIFPHLTMNPPESGSDIYLSGLDSSFPQERGHRYVTPLASGFATRSAVVNGI
ncbi:hypothetical protein GH733_009511 [Mirounga leonina]|nr:hypothetical protein GH733_009511 [Mirounga leonina]